LRAAGLEALRGAFPAPPATGTYAELEREFVKRRNSGVHALLDLALGDRVTDADEQDLISYEYESLSFNAIFNAIC
jgi:hypothetical protein